MLKKINLYLLFLCVLSIISLSFNAFYKADDYGFMNGINKDGVLGSCLRGYFEWDGRFLTIGAIIQTFSLSYFNVKVVVFFWSICYLLSGYLLSTIFQYENDLKNKFSLPVSLFATIVFWLVSMPILKEVVFWGTGGVYALDLFLAVIWVILYLKLHSNASKKIEFIGFIIFTFLVAGLSQNLSLPLLTFVMLNIIKDYLLKREYKYNFIILVSILLGLAFIQLAPGNIIRLKALDTESFDLSFLKILANFLEVTIMHIKVLKLLFVLVTITNSIYLILNFSEFKNHFLNFNFKKTVLYFIDYFKWFILSISSMATFVVIPKLVSVRTMIFFVFFMSLFIFEVSYKIYNKINMEKKALSLEIIVFIVSCIMITVNINYFIKGKKLNKLVSEREQILINGKNKTVKVKLIDTKYNNKIYSYEDYIYPEQEQYIWVKRCQEEYYNTKIEIIP